MDKSSTITKKETISVEDMMGFIKTKKRPLSKQEMKKIIRDSVVQKYAHRS